MPRAARLPSSLRYEPFRGTVAVAAGLLTAQQLRGPAWRRLFRDVYICADAVADHLTLCKAAAVLLPPGAALSYRSAALLHNVNILGLSQPVEPPRSAVCAPSRACGSCVPSWARATCGGAEGYR